MPSYTIPDPETLKREINDSHERCKKMGINPNHFCNPSQESLSTEALSRRLEANRDFLNIAIDQIEELYQFVAGAGFAVNIADRDGYILHIIGDEPIVKKLKAGNCRPGFRWTEKDVGTSVISLALARQIPVQINDDEHYCRRGHGHTCSASPVFDPENRLIGIIALSGDASQVHPHTLGMVITAARAIENQIRIQKASKQLLLHNEYMNAIIDSIDSGVMAVGKDGVINQINNKGRNILCWSDPLEGQQLSVLFGSQIDSKRLMQPGVEFIDQEVFIRSPQRNLQTICTAKPIFDAAGRMQGIIVVFNEINRIRRLVNEMAGTQARFTFEDIIGASPAIQDTRKMAMVAALGSSTVLLLGETGTGKELFAQSIHNHSERKDHPFLAINCGAIPRELLESELFGYVGGAFSGARRSGRPGKFELADGGTVFLDEIADMPADMQVKLLRVLQTGEVYRVGEHKSISVDVRIVAATNTDLKALVQNGNFREDLFYRLNVLPITIPPLRDRPEDVLPLARHILNRCTQVLNKTGLKYSPDAEQMLLAYSWPGNIRELENVVERAVNLTASGAIEPDTLGLQATQIKNPVKRIHGRMHLAELERQAIIEIVEDSDFNMSRASKVLGISRATLYNKIKKYNIAVERLSV